MLATKAQDKKKKTFSTNNEIQIETTTTIAKQVHKLITQERSICERDDCYATKVDCLFYKNDLIVPTRSRKKETIRTQTKIENTQQQQQQQQQHPTCGTVHLVDKEDKKILQLIYS